MADLYQYLKENENLALTLNFNPLLFGQQMLDQSSQFCSVVKNTENSVEVVCDYRESLQRKVGLADMIALRQMVAGELMLEILSNAYSETGVEQIAKAQAQAPLTPQQMNERLASTPGYGLLRASHKLGLLRELGSDTSAAWHFVLEHQSEVCPAQAYPWDPIRRKGYVFENGLCYNAADSREPLDQLDASLKGPIKIATVQDGREQTIRLNPFVIADHPIADLRSNMPSSYDRCGNPTAWRDPSMGGLLPDGNANNFGAPESCPR